MEVNASPQEQKRLTEHIISQFYNRTSGRGSTECTRNYPRDVFFVGNLRSEDGTAIADGREPHLPELLNKLAPVAFGAEFRIHPTDRSVARIKLEWTCYYRVFPTYTQQVDYRHNLSGGSTESVQNANPSQALQTPIDDTDVEESSSETISKEIHPEDETEVDASDGRLRRPNDTLMLRFRAIRCSAEGELVLCRNAEGGWNCDANDVSEAVKQKLQNAHDAVAQDPETIRVADDPYAQILVPDSALDTPEAYQDFCNKLRQPVIPSWDWEVRCDSREDVDEQDFLIVSVVFVNRTAKQESAEGKAHPSIEHFVFDTAAHFMFEQHAVQPFSIELAPKGFRYDREVWARPFNCAIERSGTNALSTTHIPTFTQNRYQTRVQPTASFSELASEPIPTLEKILEAMKDYRSEWATAEKNYESSIPAWRERHLAEFNSDRSRFDEEITLFQAGLDLIRRDSDTELAFRLTNETFLRSGQHSGKTSWRLFQIVFLVSQIPGITALADKPGSQPDDLQRADIIYFPTGGGKTEAYLSVLTFHCFFDRLRGKSAGVTAWTRFPLRLLTLQQTQRVADVICMADLVRRSHDDSRLNGPSIAGFGVGYFVGKSSTPNELVNSEQYSYANAENIATWACANDDDERQHWRRLIHCPSCWSNTVRVELDVTHMRLLHRCSQPDCQFPEGRIPVYVVDNEIYRYLPTVLVGTIDKLAVIGNQRKMAQIFGDIDGYCKLHGFHKGKCCQKGCDGKNLVAKIPAGLSGPTIFVQDELHLLKEGLGTFDGHYETFVQELLRAISPGAPLKIIASSATIENFERQVEHLYGADPELARIFPGPGPQLGASFYAHTLDYPQRVYAGLIPHNKTIFNASLELLEHYHAILQELIALPAGSRNPYGGSTAPDTHDWFALLDLYVTSLTYFLSSRDLNSVRTDLDGHVSPRLQAMNLSPLRIFELTGSTTTDEVATTLEYLDTSKPVQERATSVLATNMVSHGVDIDRLNAMFFYGMPRQNAEYIQASSRVGRAHVGLVFVCHHPARERDQSHYAVFSKFHEYVGQLVEPVAINRWATFSINRTLPGLFMGFLLQIMANKAEPKNVNQYYRIDHVRQQIASGRLRADDFIPFLERSYRVANSNEPAQQAFREEIRLRAQQFLDQIVQASPAKTFVSDALIPRPLTSLRDVDEPIPIGLDRAGTQWASYMDTRGRFQ